MFGRDRVPIEGKVLAAAVHKSHTTQEGLAYRRMKYVVECRVPGEAVQRVELKETERFGSKVMRSLNKGEKVPLLVDRKSGKIRFDVDDPQISLKVWIKQVNQREDSNFKKALGD